MRCEDKIINIPRKTGLLLFRIAQQTIMVQVAEPRRRIGSMIDYVGYQEHCTEHNGDPIGRAVRADLTMSDEPKAGEQQDGRAGIQDSMKEREGPGIETKIDFCLWNEDNKGDRRRNGNRDDNDRLGKVSLRGGRRGRPSAGSRPVNGR